MQTIIQRVCWNSRGWQMPSGSAYEKGYPSEMGFGYEEWNFQLRDAFNDYVYGYTYSKPAENKIRKSGGKFRIVFFSIHPETKDRLVVGIYHEAEIIPEEAYSPLFKYFKNEGIFKRRAKELLAVSQSFTLKQALEVTKAVKSLSVRCPTSKIETFSQYPSLTKIVGNQPVGNRFTTFTYLMGEFPKNRTGHAKLTRLDGDDYTQRPLAEDAYYRESGAKLMEIIPRHNKLSNDFCAWLKNQHGIMARQEQHRADVIFSFNNQSVLAELKVCYGAGTTKAIREALGQLLEYNHYPARKTADVWLIVLDEKPSKNDQVFIDVLRETRSLPVSVGWQIDDQFLFHPVWPLKQIRQ
ncbi:MAG: hypothetical protein WHS86_16240 [Desulfosoma sp.]